MLQELANRAQRAIDTVVSKYVSRLAVAVPFVVALGFGTAAASVKLTEMYGSMLANAVLAGVFTIIGVVTAAAIAVSHTAPELAAAQPVGGVAEESATQQSSNEPLLPNADVMLAAVGAIGPAAMPFLFRLILRNLPLVLGVLVLAYLLLSDTGKSRATTTEVPKM